MPSRPSTPSGGEAPRPDTRIEAQSCRISVVTPTFRRPSEVVGLLENLQQQTLLPFELLLVDGSPAVERETEERVAAAITALPFRCHYIRQGGGTAIQRNFGIDASTGEFIAFIDDDIRLEPDFFETMIGVFHEDRERRVGGVAGYITNQHLDPNRSPRWRWYRRLRLFTTYEPGRFDFASGYAINRYLQPPHDGLRTIDSMGSNCGVWRAEVLAGGLRFSTFFTDYGMVEDAHFALRAGRKWRLLECGRARCIHLRAPGGRVDTRRIGWKSAVNYRYLFMDIVPHRTWKQEYRFWRVQAFDLLRQTLYAVRSRRREDWLGALGKVEGILAATRIRPESQEKAR